MPLMLGIYALDGRINQTLVKPVVDDFISGGDRFASQKFFPGCLLVSVNELEGEDNLIQAEGSADIGLFVGSVFSDASPNSDPKAILASHLGNLSAFDALELEGAFTLAFYQPEQHRLTVCNDKFGVRPLFVAESEGHVFFCSEYEPLNLLKSKTINHQAIADYFCFGTTLNGETFREGIENLPPANVTAWEKGIKREQVYWQSKLKIDRSSSIEVHAIALAVTLKEVVNSSFAQLSNPLCLLSAGADSRLIVTCLDAEKRKQIPYLTSNLSVLAAVDDRDVIGANAVAEKLGLSLHEVTKMAFAEEDFGTDYFIRNRQLRAQKVFGGWHGGEFLGGYCLKAAPIRAALTEIEVNESLKKNFSWWFRRKLKSHPFVAYQSARKAITSENQDLHFMIDQMTRGFFSNIYMGSRGHWLQPWQIIIHGYSPFWDSRFLQQLLTVPMEMLENYNLYNKIFALAFPELIEIPSNSPLTNRDDSCIPKLTAGKEPKIVLQPLYQNALNSFRDDSRVWKRGQYPKLGFKQHLEDGMNPATIKFIDFEAWFRHFGQ
jgi:hypothetical protein